MSTTFLEAMNATLKRVRVIQGDIGELGTSTVASTATGAVATDAFVVSGIQVQIDLGIQLWQEAIHEVFGLGLFANEAATATLNLLDATREYSLPSDFERFAGDTYEDRVFRGVTSGLVVSEYPGGYARMLRDQVVATDFTGDPQHYALSPVNGKVRFDREPTTAQAGNSYHVLYEKRISLTSTMATETFPVTDTTVDALVPVVAEAWNRIQKNEFDSGLFQASLVRAVNNARRTQPRRRYGKR